MRFRRGLLGENAFFVKKTDFFACRYDFGA